MKVKSIDQVLGITSTNGNTSTSISLLLHRAGGRDTIGQDFIDGYDLSKTFLRL